MTKGHDTVHLAIFNAYAILGAILTYLDRSEKVKAAVELLSQATKTTLPTIILTLRTSQ